MTGNITYRIAQETDIPQLNLLVNSAYRGETSKQGWTYEADLLDGQRIDVVMLQDIINSDQDVIYLGFVADKLFGCAHLRQEANNAYIGMLTIQPELQAHGLGKNLLANAEQWIRHTWSCNFIEMTVIQMRTELIAWYERRGYIVTAERRPFPYGDLRFGKPKLQDLEFIVLQKNLDAVICE